MEVVAGHEVSTPRGSGWGSVIFTTADRQCFNQNAESESGPQTRPLPRGGTDDLIGPRVECMPDSVLGTSPLIPVCVLQCHYQPSLTFADHHLGKDALSRSEFLSTLIVAAHFPGVIYNSNIRLDEIDPSSCNSHLAFFITSRLVTEKPFENCLPSGEQQTTPADVTGVISEE